jgi:hypothetical protein
LERLESIEQMRANLEQQLARMLAKVQPNPLRPDRQPYGIDVYMRKLRFAIPVTSECCN